MKEEKMRKRERERTSDPKHEEKNNAPVLSLVIPTYNEKAFCLVVSVTKLIHSDFQI